MGVAQQQYAIIAARSSVFYSPTAAGVFADSAAEKGFIDKSSVLRRMGKHNL